MQKDKNKNSLPTLIEDLAGAIEEKGLTIKFGLEQQGHISIIEEMIARQGNNYHTWKEIAAQIAWEPLTACIHYNHYLDKKREREGVFTRQSIKNFFAWLRQEGWYEPEPGVWYNSADRIKPSTIEELLDYWTQSGHV
jgi:hypothetical protein